MGEWTSARYSVQSYIVLSDLRVQYMAYFGNLGPERPKHVVVRPTTATDLPEFFKKKKLSMQDFEKVRRGTYWPGKSSINSTVTIRIPDKSGFQMVDLCPKVEW